MALFDSGDVKAEKVGALHRYNRLQRFTKWVRSIELCLALVFLPRIVNCLPLAVKISGDFFRQLACVVTTPLFVFLLSNAIIVTLMLKSGRFCGENPAANHAESEIYEELAKGAENRSPKLSSENNSPANEEIVFEDKEIIVPQANVSPARACEADGDDVEVGSFTDSESDKDSGSDSDSEFPKFYRRTKSERLNRKGGEGNVRGKKELRRSETERCRKVAASGEELNPEDELSDEEFQRTVDEFIAKHLLFRRQESLAVALQNQTSIAEIEAQ